MIIKFLKFIYLDLWIPANFYFSILYAQVSQIKFLVEVMTLIALGWLYLTGKILDHKQLIIIFLFLFSLGILAGLGRLGLVFSGLIRFFRFHAVGRFVFFVIGGDVGFFFIHGFFLSLKFND